MQIDVDALIEPLSDEAPSGPDLSYDSERQAIELAFEKSVGGDDSGADVDWDDTIRKIVTQSASTRDVCLPVFLMRAGAKAGHLDTVEAGANLLAGILENLWDTVHPQLEEYGFQGRKAPCESLTRIGEFLNPLRSVALLEHPRLGRYTGADFDRFRDNGASEDGYGMFRALIEETDDAQLREIIDRIGGIGDAIRRADAVLTNNAEGDTATNFQPTYEALELLRKCVGAFSKEPIAADAGDDIGGEGPSRGQGGEGASPGQYSGAINSRDDVIRALDAIAAYYSRKEPGSPVPFVLRRARNWVSLDFISVLEDIAPNSLEEARRVLMDGRGGGGSDGWSSGSDDSWSSGSDE